ncbi:MAG: aminopeptidase P family protein [Acidobacteria bacterium]|nr:aminopeptidase P family protein [Acidobacteriota bacterium]
MDYRGRRLRVVNAIEERRLDVLLISHLPNIRYLSGFSGSSGVLLITSREAVLITDGRYSEQAKREVEAARVKIVKKSPLTAAAEWLLKRRALRRIGFDPAHMIVADRRALAKVLGRSRSIVEAPPIVDELRMIKDAEEIQKIRAACLLGVELFSTLTSNLRPGISEARLAGLLELTAREEGAEQMSFPTIVASGERSALAHHRARNVPVPDRGFVVLDYGVILRGYCSDMTRTAHVARPTREARGAYEAVREAQQAALDVVKPGVTAGEVDHAARKLLYNRKLGRFFTHSTGHGVGLEIHEAPRLAAAQEEVLLPGMVITIEPGVYLPGKWGVRIEDTVVLTDTGCDILTPCPKDLLTF